MFGRSPDASWHVDYRDTAYIYIGGLPFELSEGDIITIFSQFGEPTYVDLIRDKETGKSKGFAFLKYEDQRSTDLAVDNLGGATILNRIIRVDHTRYRKKEEEGESDQSREESSKGAGAIESAAKQKDDLVGDGDTRSEGLIFEEERELAALIRDHDDDDPMKAFLIQEKEEAITAALARLRDSKTFKSDKMSKHHPRHRQHHHRHSHRLKDLDERENGKRHAQRPRGDERRPKSHSES